MSKDYIKQPEKIEERSFEIISEILGDRNIDGIKGAVVKRVIHTTADFEYMDLLEFSPDFFDKMIEIFKNGCTIVSDTNMIKAGVSAANANKLNIKIECFVNNEKVHENAKAAGITRSMAAVDMVSSVIGPLVYVVGNAPTAIFRILENIEQGKISPSAVIGVPVGFVGAAESKDALWGNSFPHVITRGRKGGSTVAVAIINALMRETIKQTNMQDR